VNKLFVVIHEDFGNCFFVRKDREAVIKAFKTGLKNPENYINEIEIKEIKTIPEFLALDITSEFRLTDDASF